jgi:ATP-dependent protease ClpP protease subunit
MNRPDQIIVPDGVCSASDRFKGVCPERYANWFRVENAVEMDAEAVDIVIDGLIVDPFMAEVLGIGVSSAQVVDEIMALRGRPLTVWINSEGGLIQAGLGIYNQLLMHDAPVTTIVYGFAMSIASVIAMAGDTRIMAPASGLFIHEASGPLDGTASDHRQEAAILDQLSDQIASVYASRGDSRRSWRALMQAGSGSAQGTLIPAAEAVRLRLADRIDSKITRQPSNVVDLARYTTGMDLDGRQNAADPAAILEAPEGETPEDEQRPTIRDAEKALRDGGFSDREAKAILAEGYRSLAARDEQDEESDEVPGTDTVSEIDSELAESMAMAWSVLQRRGVSLVQGG